MRRILVTAFIGVPLLALAIFGPNDFGKNRAFGQTYKHTFMASLTGSAEVPPVSTTATGNATFEVHQSERQLDYWVSLNNARSVTMAHLHCANPGANGPVIVPLYNNPAGMDVSGRLVIGSLSESQILPAAMSCSPNISTMPHLVQAMREGKIYVNVHTTVNPGGAVRGQLAMQSTPDPMSAFGYGAGYGDSGMVLGTFKESFRTNLQGDFEVPPVATRANGDSMFNVGMDERQIRYTVNLRNISMVTDAHLHCAARGSNGPVIVPLFHTDSPSATPGSLMLSGMITEADITSAAMSCSPNIRTLPHLVQAMREGKIYVNVHTTAYPGGEIRGQLGR